MVTTIPIAKARTNLSALVMRVHLNKEYIIVEKDGLPIAGIMDINEFEDFRELHNPKVRAIIARSCRRGPGLLGTSNHAARGRDLQVPAALTRTPHQRTRASQNPRSDR